MSRQFTVGKNLCEKCHHAVNMKTSSLHNNQFHPVVEMECSHCKFQFFQCTDPVCIQSLDWRRKISWLKRKSYSMMRHVQHNHGSDTVPATNLHDLDRKEDSESDCQMMLDTTESSESLSTFNETGTTNQQPTLVQSKVLYPHLTTGGQMIHKLKDRCIEHILLKSHQGLDYVPNDLQIPVDHQFAHLLHAKFVYKLTHSQAYEFAELTKVMFKQHEKETKEKLRDEVRKELLEDFVMAENESTLKKKRKYSKEQKTCTVTGDKFPSEKSIVHYESDVQQHQKKILILQVQWCALNQQKKPKHVCYSFQIIQKT